MKLYYKPRTCSLASHIILKKNGHDFEIESVDTDNQITESGDNFSKINLRGYVPALCLDDGKILMDHFESIFDDGRNYLIGIGLDKWHRIAGFSTRVAGERRFRTRCVQRGR